jgi:hypothetical protein
MNRKNAALIEFPKRSLPIALVLAATVVNVAKAQSAARLSQGTFGTQLAVAEASRQTAGT